MEETSGYYFNLWSELASLIKVVGLVAKLHLSFATPMDCSPSGFSIHGILQARTLAWVAISFSSAWKWKVKVKSLSRVRFFTTPWTAAHQASPSMGFSRQEYWSGVPLPSPLYHWATRESPDKVDIDIICILMWYNEKTYQLFRTQAIHT